MRTSIPRRQPDHQPHNEKDLEKFHFMTILNLKCQPRLFPHALLALAAAALTACGGGEPGNKSADSSQGTQATTLGTVTSAAETRAQSDGTAVTLNVVASGFPAAGVYPEMKLLVGGREVGQVTVNSTQEQAYSFTLADRIDPETRIDVVYLNDAVVNGEDRTLVVHSVNVAGRTLLPTAPEVVYDRGFGFVDGVDVIPGRATMDWNGALRFKMPAREWTEGTTVFSPGSPVEYDTAIADSGDVYFTWQTPRLDNTGGDVWVRQYDAATRQWLAPHLIATAPPAAEGVARHARVVSVSGGPTFIVWDVTDVGVTTVRSGTSPNDPRTVAWLKRPAKLYVSQQAPGQQTWSEPQPIPATMAHPLGRVPAYPYDAGWTAADAGQGRLGVFWLGERQYLSSFYSASEGAWSEGRDMGASTGTAIAGEPYIPEDFYQGGTPQARFNRHGAGIVTLASGTTRLPSTTFGTPAFQFRDAQGPTAISAPFLADKALVDDEGNIHSVEVRSAPYGEGDLVLHTLQATTPGNDQPRSVYHWRNFAALPDDVELVPGPEGLLVSWSQSFSTRDPYGCDTCWDPLSAQWARLALPLTSTGEPAGATEVRYDISLEPNVRQSSVTGLKTRAAGSSALSVWTATCGRVDPCGKIQMYTSARDKTGQWSTPVPIKTKWPYASVFKTNQRGEAVLVEVATYPGDVTAYLLH